MISLPATAPHDPAAERAMLASFLLDPSLVDAYLGRLHEEHFYTERNAWIWGAMLQLSAAGQVIDLATVAATMELDGVLDRAGGRAYLAELDLDLPDIGHVESYFGILTDRLARRRLIVASVELATDAAGGERDLAVLLAAAQARLTRAEDGARRESFVSSMELVTTHLASLRERPPGEGLGVATGFASIDRRTNGLSKGQLILIAGRPGMGKSVLAENMMIALAQDDVPVGFVSLEMTREELTRRSLSQQSGIEHRKLRRHDEQVWPVIEAAGRRLALLPYWIDDTAALSPQEIVGRARRLKAEGGLRVLFVDHLHLINHHYERGWSKVDAVTHTSRTLKILARELDITVVALCQLNRSVDERSDKRPVLSDLRESGSLEQDADVVCFIYRQEVYTPQDAACRGRAELIFAKVRDAESGHIEHLYFDAPRVRFTEFDPGRGGHQQRIGGM